MEGELKQQLADIRDWQHKHGLADEERFSNLPTKEEVKDIAKAAMLEAIQESGSSTLKVIILLGTVGGALAGIIGGWQALLWLFKH